MSDTVILVRHVGEECESRYDTTTFATEGKTGVLLVYGDPAKRELLAVYNASGWFSAQFVDRSTFQWRHSETSDKVVLVRHISGEGESTYDTSIFVTEGDTGVLLIYSDAAKRVLIAAYHPQDWISAEFIERVIDDDSAEDAMEAERPL